MGEERGTDSIQQLVIRTLHRSDRDRIVQLDRASVGRDRGMWIEKKLERALTDSAVSISLGGELDGTLVGVVMGSVQYGEYGLPEPVAVLDTILVDPARRSQGVGQALIEQLSKNLSGLRVEVLRTEVAWDEVELIRFLANTHFRPAHRLVLERRLGSD